MTPLAVSRAQVRAESRKCVLLSSMPFNPALSRARRGLCRILKGSSSVVTSDRLLACSGNARVGEGVAVTRTNALPLDGLDPDRCMSVAAIARPVDGDSRRAFNRPARAPHAELKDRSTA